MHNPDYSAILGAVDFFRNKRILCIGDVMLDRYIYGDVDRISPEAPIPVFSAKREESMLGAAGNVAKNIAALGAKVDFYSAVGDDKDGVKIKSLLEKELNITPYIITKGKTTVKTRYISGNQQMIRVDEDGMGYHFMALPDNLAEMDAVIFSDYNKGMINDSTPRESIISSGIPTIVDTKGWIGMYKEATVVTPNLGELANNVDWFSQTGSDEDVKRAAAQVLETNNMANVLVTRASKGMTLQTRNNETYHIPAVAREVYDVVGAGDTVAAVLALGLACNLSMMEAAIIANVAGGIVVGKRGTATCTPMELKTCILAAMNTTLN